MLVMSGRIDGQVITSVITWAMSSSHASVTCTLYPVQRSCRFMLKRASGSYGDWIRSATGGSSAAERQRSRPASRA
uniref:hypothetical protein n=1 Tax=uncultured Sphingomonas sp. TaxID=158754 RepID=UPI0025FBC7A0|nr:hypothetical protein [uncultured Sphingomonas sp.]